MTGFVKKHIPCVHPQKLPVPTSAVRISTAEYPFNITRSNNQGHQTHNHTNPQQCFAEIELDSLHSSFISRQPIINLTKTGVCPFQVYTVYLIKNS